MNVLAAKPYLCTLFTNFFCFILQFGARRCLTKEECKNLPRPISLQQGFPFPYIPFREEKYPFENGKCLLDCPVGYVKTECAKNANLSCRNRCERCYGTCEKHCLGGVIDSISTAQQYKECTVIDGALEISIRNQGGCKYFCFCV